MTATSSPPVSTGKEQGGTWTKGQSGNPAGRPRGARNKTTLAVESLLQGEAEQLTRRVIEVALSGDTTALRLCMDRIAPASKDRTATFTMPKVGGPEDVPKALLSLLEAVSEGDLTPGEAAALTAILERYRQAVETADLDARLTNLEIVNASRP